MLLLSKSIAQLLLPPGGLILLALLGLIFWRKFWGRACIALALLCFWLLSTEPIRDVLTSSLEYQYPAFDVQHIDNHLSPLKGSAIVVLGNGTQENSLDYQGSDELGRYGMMRTIYGAKIAEKTGLDIYPTGGSPLTHDTESEASIMRRWLIWFGLPQSRIHIENQANTTWENALLTKKILAQKDINTIILVTSAWHMPRSVWCFEAQGLKVIPAPTDYLTEQKPYDIRSFLPRWNVFSDSGSALHEYLGVFWYRLKYSNQHQKEKL